MCKQLFIVRDENTTQMKTDIEDYDHVQNYIVEFVKKYLVRDSNLKFHQFLDHVITGIRRQSYLSQSVLLTALIYLKRTNNVKFTTKNICCCYFIAAITLACKYIEDFFSNTEQYTKLFESFEGFDQDCNEFIGHEKFDGVPFGLTILLHCELEIWKALNYEMHVTKKIILNFISNHKL